MQSTYAGFQRLSPDAVFKVCDQPHPMLVTQVLKMCMARNFTEAVKIFHGADPYHLRLHRITSSYGLVSHVHSPFGMDCCLDFCHVPYR